MMEHHFTIQLAVDGGTSHVWTHDKARNLLLLDNMSIPLHIQMLAS